MYASLYSCRMCFVTVLSVDATLSFLPCSQLQKRDIKRSCYSSWGYVLVHTSYHSKLGWCYTVAKSRVPCIILYPIDTSGKFTREKLKAYKSLEVYNYYVSRWVGTYHIHIISEEFCLLKAEVRPSQRVNSASHQPWVVVRRRDGCTSAAHCTCMKAYNITGVQKLIRVHKHAYIFWLGEVCSHVAAWLSKLKHVCDLATQIQHTHECLVNGTKHSVRRYNKRKRIIQNIVKLISSSLLKVSQLQLSKLTWKSPSAKL